VKAGARRSAVVGAQQNELRVDVSAPPEKGQANATAIRLLARFFGIPQSSVVLLAGRANPHKHFVLLGASLAEVSSRIDEMDQSNDG
jgi:uncharacterized protein (TIGR00251 family)